MSRWPNAFFFAASIYILIGANWGLYMSITHDFATAPAHAHLNLLGWVSLALMGSFYALLGKNTPPWLVKTNFFLSNLGVIAMITGLGLLFTGKATVPQLAPLIAVGELSVIGGFISFAWAVFVSLGVRLSQRRSVAA
ncbi:MAG: hypothetical protein Q8L66_01490 [Caulobacter sp.]|nr:hypothetical protein [Caulobacter sp.]